MIQLDAIGIVAKDIVQSLRFYSLLGVPVPHANDVAGQDHVEATLPNGLRLMFDSEKMIQQISPDWRKPSGQGMTLAFLCESPAAVDSTYAKVLAAGFRAGKEPWDAFWGQRYAVVVDPDGNHVDLFARLI
jgi:uncharacterized glyoxalase superfamily protein PhnB